MQTNSNTSESALEPIQCPSCLQTVAPIAASVCTVCGEDLAVLLALRETIARLAQTRPLAGNATITRGHTSRGEAGDAQA